MTAASPNASTPSPTPNCRSPPTSSDFGTDLSGLRRRLRDIGVRIYDSFPDYGKDFRRRLGIESEQAMELFHQTVSMKSVDNLNDFVRSHMLEPFDSKAQIDSLVEHFDNLTRAHDAVVRARDQLDRLGPLVELLDEFDQLGAEAAEITKQQEAVPYHFARLTQQLYGAQLVDLAARLERTGATLAVHGSELAALREKETQLRVEIAVSGGDRLDDDRPGHRETGGRQACPPGEAGPLQRPLGRGRSSAGQHQRPILDGEGRRAGPPR